MAKEREQGMTNESGERFRELPSYDECESVGSTGTALQKFIWDNEPAKESEADRFRETLRDVLTDVRQAALSEGRRLGIEEAYQYVRDWRICDCGYEVEGKFTAQKYNTECGHAIECDYYLADSIWKLGRALLPKE